MPIEETPVDDGGLFSLSSERIKLVVHRKLENGGWNPLDRDADRLAELLFETRRQIVNWGRFLRAFNDDKELATGVLRT
jgi:hypothetical protein